MWSLITAFIPTTWLWRIGGILLLIAALWGAYKYNNYLVRKEALSEFNNKQIEQNKKDNERTKQQDNQISESGRQIVKETNKDIKKEDDKIKEVEKKIDDVKDAKPAAPIIKDTIKKLLENE